MNWRLIEQQAYNAAMNMAIDEDVYESVASGKQLPTIRFYKWKNNSVSLGTFQNQSEINLEKCKKNNVDVVRRITGGRAVYRALASGQLRLVWDDRIAAHDSFALLHFL